MRPSDGLLLDARVSVEPPGTAVRPVGGPRLARRSGVLPLLQVKLSRPVLDVPPGSRGVLGPSHRRDTVHRPPRGVQHRKCSEISATKTFKQVLVASVTRPPPRRQAAPL